MKELQLPTVTSSLELFSWTDKKFIPSCYELEPFHDDNVIFCGSLKHRNVVSHQQKDKILVYMGNGTISQKKMVTEIKTAFQNSNYHVYIAGMGLNEEHFDTIHIAPYFDFKSLLPEALLFINHGGQNSIIDGLIYGVPQLICPGKVFERRFNAQSIEKNHAGIELSYTDFSAECILRYADKILSDSQYQNNAENLGNILVSLGGTQNIIRALRGN
ncbi:glycosyltransferase [Anaerosporobacter sp.]|uniref:glycosyltransferase n=1 Tax=Anaerosporobacter sp. TaxID=1872529 RepID=UPI00286EF71F|nr:nucleotide disphospho-sugar-binding domain-containing protein [Anaerosporobacter sp.]